MFSSSPVVQTGVRAVEFSGADTLPHVVYEVVSESPWIVSVVTASVKVDERGGASLHFPKAYCISLSRDTAL
jgi:hypothetical protein